MAGPDVWHADMLAADNRWTHILNDSDRIELHNALNQVKASGLNIFHFDRTDFKLPRLGSRIREIMEDVERGRGLALLRGLNIDKYNLNDLTLLYWCLGVHMGKPISQNARGDLIGNVRDTGKSYDSLNIRGYTTNAALPPHCDPADIVSLLCVEAAPIGGQSLIANAPAIFNEIMSNDPELLEPLFRGFHFDLRGEGTTGEINEVTRHRVPVFHWLAGRLSCRYNRRTIIDGQNKAGRPLSGLELRAINRVAELAEDDRFRFEMTLLPGDIQILSNHTVLHFRRAFENHKTASSERHLLRLWGNVDEELARPLEPEFAERLNNGPRGGVFITESHAGWVP
ncbi:MAG: hypothetical protein CMF65_13885 [Magnetovibrio sp.]|nr:hypothetical protein [Magnetovibrio sp.]